MAASAADSDPEDGTLTPGGDPPSTGPGAVGPDLSSANRIGPLSGMPDWSRAGYLGGQPLPGDGDMNPDPTCNVTPDQLASKYRVIANDRVDDTTGLQKAIDDIKSNCSPTANYHKLSLITLPAGRIDVSRQMYVDASFLTIRGQGSGDGGTKFVFRPDTDTRYDTLTNGRWWQDAMVYGAAPDEGSGGWVWPGRGMFRVQTRTVAARYQDEWSAAPANRKDLFEGSINQHWVSGLKLSSPAGDPGFSARQGQSVVHLDPKANMSKLTVGAYVWVGAANSRNFYAQQGISGDDEALEDPLMMRQQMFQVASLDTTAKTVTLDRPLEWDLPVDDTSDGSRQYLAKLTPSKLTPLEIVEGVGFENFAFTQDMAGLPMLDGSTFQGTPEQAVNNYGNMAPEYAMHGIVFKWAANSWARGLTATMTGSHPIVTEDALNLQIERNSFDGSWNKGKGGNGYLRGSRVWSSLYAYNLSRHLRHFTFQWSASDNVAFRNDLDSDLNLHGGWEHNNLFEQNTVVVAYDHRSGSCTANCGGEGGEIDEGTWYPIWWAAGPKAIKWSGSSGAQNVFYNNSMIKQATPGGDYADYAPYGTREGTAFEFGSDNDDPAKFHHLSQDGQVIPDWTGRETANYLGQGVVARDMSGQPSLFLRDPTIGQLAPRDIGDRDMTTWNMQGANMGTNSDRWNTDVARLARNTQIVALQEAGPVAPMRMILDGAETPINLYVPRGIAGTYIPGLGHSNGQRRVSIPLANASAAQLPQLGYGDRVRQQIWEMPDGQRRIIYFLQTDPHRVNGRDTYRGGQFNLAFVTRGSARDVAAIPGVDGGRGSLGLRFGNTWYFNVHASSGNGGADAGILLQRINTFVTNRARQESWVVMGDWNQTPTQLLNRPGFPVGAGVISAGRPTQQRGRIIDYFVTSSQVTGLQTTQLERRPLDAPLRVYRSDHAPVHLGALAAAAEPQDLFRNPRALTNMTAGGVLTVDDPDNPGSLSTSVLHRQLGQRWKAVTNVNGTISLTAILANAAACLALLPALIPSASASPVPSAVTDCNADDPSQQWDLDYQGNDEWHLRNHAQSSQCLIGDVKDDPRQHEPVGVADCTNSPAPQALNWTFTEPNTFFPQLLSPEDSDLTDRIAGPVSMENLNVGALMTVTDGATSNNSTVGQFERNGDTFGHPPAPNQGWNVDWLSDGLTATLRGVGSNRCIQPRDGLDDAPGTQLVIMDCDSSNVHQQWTALQHVAGDQTLVQWRNVADGLCMDVAGAPTDPDVGNLIVFNCSETAANQLWAMTPYDPTGLPVLPDDDET
ncbi:ricin-type beta-trefoil lectin domain protein [Streptomyces sp. NPDC047841]|uniref:ricin-type beta-trefoil lectin domain protein n=1 Tax=Streptomyces sp. NPDC047841 TaxID=3154708 RepID=UPI0034517079